jgi:hypothetical protein
MATSTKNTPSGLCLIGKFQADKFERGIRPDGHYQLSTFNSQLPRFH